MTPSDFAGRLAVARRVLVIEFGGLGDHLHSLPALRLLRACAPHARLHVLGDGGGVFRSLAPWIDEASDYGRKSLRTDLDCLRLLRAQDYDVAVQLMQSNRGTALLGLSGARLRVARRNDSHKRWWWQPLLLSRTLRAPYHEYPMFQQRWDCLHDAGLAGVRPTRLTDAGAVIDPALRRARGIAPEDDGHYLHLSASATDDLRDLPPAQMRELWEALHTQFPRHRLAVSASNTVRGRGKLKALLDALSFTPWKVFAGDLDVPAFASVIQGAALHVGPDSGGLHIARIAGTPSVSWFRPNEHLGNWLPTEPGHRAVVAPESTAEGLQGIAAEALVGLARELLDGH